MITDERSRLLNVHANFGKADNEVEGSTFILTWSLLNEASSESKKKETLPALSTERRKEAL